MSEPIPGLDLEGAPEEVRRAFQDAFRTFTSGARTLQEAMSTPVGQSPRELIWQLNKTRLYRYTPLRPPEECHATPLLLVYALINKPYIFDLQPGKSLIEHLLAAGFDVYLLDWGTPGPEDAGTTFNDYAHIYLRRAVRKVLSVSGAPSLSLLGYCIGATIAAYFAAAYPDAPLRNLVLLTPPIDFSDKRANAFTVWLDQKHLNVDRLVEAFGNIPVELIETGAKLLKPVENYLGSYVSMMERVEQGSPVEGWQAMHKWVHDGVPFAGAAFRQWSQDYIRENKLFEGAFVHEGRGVDLANITCPLLVIIATYDHIVPNQQSRSILEKVGSQDRHLEEIAAGHVGIVISRSAKTRLWPALSGWLAERD